MSDSITLKMDFGQYSWPERSDPTEPLTCYLRETVQPKMNVVPNLYDFLSSGECKRYSFLYSCNEWEKLSSFKMDHKTCESLKAIW